MFGGIFIIALIIGLAIGYGILILFCLTLKSVIEAADIQNRAVDSGKVWLMLIPIFNMVYPFFLFPKISTTIKNQLEQNNAAETGDYALMLGRSYPILYLLQLIIPNEAIGGLLSIAGLVCLIVFWVKMGSYRVKMIATRNNGDATRTVLNKNPDLLD